MLSSKRRAARILAFYLLTTLGFIALVEGLARLGGFEQRLLYPLDERLGWRMVVPSERFTPFGRDAEVVLLGDSLGYLDIEQPFSYTQQLVRSGIKALNLSVLGYGDDQEFLSLQFHAKDLPKVKLVVLDFCLFIDFIDNVSATDPLLGYPRKPYFIVQDEQLVLKEVHYNALDYVLHFMKENSATYIFLIEGLVKLHLIPSTEERMEKINSWQLTRELTMEKYQPYHEHLLRGFPVTAKILLAMRRFVEEQLHAKFVVLLYPSGYHPDPRAYLALSPEFKTFFSALNMNIYDLGCFYRREGLKYTDVAKDMSGHLTPQGHSEVAQVIKEIVSHRLSHPECLLSKEPFQSL